MMNRDFLPALTLVAASMLFTGCAGTPQGPVTQAPAPVVAKQETSRDLDPALAEAAKGYERVNKNGKLFFCRRERPVGSQMYTTVCVSEAQLREQAVDNQKVQEKVREQGRR